MNYQTIFECIPDALLVIDDAGRIREANAHAGSLFGHAPTDLTGVSIELLLPGLSTCRARYQRPIAGKTGRAGAGGEPGLTGRRRDQTEFPAEVALCAIGPEDQGADSRGMDRRAIERRASAQCFDSLHQCDHG